MTKAATLKADDIGAALMAMLGIVSALILAVLWGGFWAGLAVSTLWGWFVVPVFAVQSISIAQAYGLALIVRALMWNYSGSERDKRGFGENLARAVVAPPLIAALLLLVGWGASAWV